MLEILRNVGKFVKCWSLKNVEKLGKCWSLRNVGFCEIFGFVKC